MLGTGLEGTQMRCWKKKERREGELNRGLGLTYTDSTSFKGRYDIYTIPTISRQIPYAGAELPTGIWGRMNPESRIAICHQRKCISLSPAGLAVTTPKFCPFHIIYEAPACHVSERITVIQESSEALPGSFEMT